VFHPLYWEVAEVQPRKASEFACVVLVGTSEGFAGLIALERAHCRCCGTESSCRIVYSENPS